MWQLDPPEVVEVVRKNRLVEQIEPLKSSRKIAVVSIFGTSHWNLSGHKRAFRLAIDTFGNSNIFSGTGATFEECKESSVELVDGHGQDNEASLVVNDVTELIEKFCIDNNDTDELRNVDPFPDNPKEVPFAGDGAGRNGEAVGDIEEKEGQPGNGCGDGEGALANSFTSPDVSYLDGFYNATEGILFLHLSGAYDPHQLIIAVEELRQTLQETGFIPVWSTLKSKYCRYLLLMFSLSHILIVSDTGTSLDTSYLHLFRMLDAVRLEIKPAIIRVLEKVGTLNRDWIAHGRICCPRLLFLFEIESESAISAKTAATLHKGVVREKQSQLEDEIYHILRKCRIITNISANSLFAIPSEDEYVFLYEKSAQNAVYVEDKMENVYFEMIHQACSNAKNSQLPSTSSAYRSTSGTSIKHAFRSDPKSITYTDVLHKFKEFIFTHIHLALTKGFDDDSRRVAEHRHFFVNPSFQQWKLAFQALSGSLLCSNVKSRTIKEGLDHLERFINVDSQYLQNQCANVFPKIYALYQRGLPEFYSEKLHGIRLTHAMNAYLSISRGAGVFPWLKKLAEKCDKYWKRGRQQCEVTSLFNHSCINPMHRVSPEDSLEIFSIPELDAKLPETKHSTGSRLVSYCNCGRRQGCRDEPFTIREANYSFYQRLRKECCDRLETHKFPRFTPAAPSGLSNQDMIKILKLKSNLDSTGENSDCNLEEHSNGASQVMETDLRQENLLGDGDEGSDNSQNEPENQLLTEERVEDANMESINEASSVEAESIVSNTEEYLPGMLHSKSPPGLLPQFPSWSLVCVGSSSLYNHSSGLGLRQGFLSGTNFLLPWDVMVKAEAGVSKPVPRIIRGKRPSLGRPRPISDEFSVKVFIGLEYECQRGHRFLANDFEKVVNFNTGNSGSLREAGTKIANSDMPLYFKCPCKESRDGRTMIAQLIRIHIVTPKAPVHCMLFPRVQPAPTPCPTFSPGISEPVKLTPSSYWVLRLPYCYVGDEIYVQPLEADMQRSNGKLLKGTFSVIPMTPSETKAWEKQALL